MGSLLSKRKARKSCNESITVPLKASEETSSITEDSESYGAFFGDSSPPDTPKIAGCKKFTHLSSIIDDVDALAAAADPADYEYDFENLVFEGGGNKGLAYCGAVRVLEEMGIAPKIKRFAGASAGAMTAALMAVGYTSQEIEDFLSQDLRRVFLDHSCGYCSLLPNLIRYFGWNPGKRIFEWFGEKIEARTGDKDFTFGELYENEKFQKELCVVVTNLNQLNTEYCHPKITPKMPIRVAVRMSMAIPGMFAASRYSVHGHTDVYVDGGVLCNFPIHCFDGWYLSMKSEDNLLRRLQPLSKLPELFEKKNRFGTYNEKTLGFLLYADHEQEMFRTSLEKRRGTELPTTFPKTELFKKYKLERKMEKEANRKYGKVIKAVDAFLKALAKHDINKDDKINFEELKSALADEETFSREHADNLFGGQVTADEAFRSLVNQETGDIRYADIMRYLERNGYSIQAQFLGYRRKNIDDFAGFLDTLQATLLTNVKRIYMEERDVSRTVGINTGYVGTTDFKLEPEDRNFLVKQGRRAIVAFLKYNAAERDLAKKVASTTPRDSDEQTRDVFTFSHVNDMEKDNSHSAQENGQELNTR